METLADLTSLTELLLTPYLTQDCRLEKDEGLDFTIFSINGSASMALPSTTSIMNSPLM